MELEKTVYKNDKKFYIFTLAYRDKEFTACTYFNTPHSQDKFKISLKEQRGKLSMLTPSYGLYPNTARIANERSELIISILYIMYY